MMKLHQFLEQSARKYSGKTAVVDAERGITATYGELQKQAESIQEQLAAAGVVEGDRIGICMPKSIASLAGLFGALRAGAAYVPVDCTAPAVRNALIFNDCAVRAILVAGHLAEGLCAELGNGRFRNAGELAFLAPYGVPAILLVAEPQTQTPFDGVDTSNLAYILYTSGSTGKPKGVMHTHASALAFIDWCSELFAPNADDCFSSHASFHFDLSILDIYVCIKHGGKLVLLGESLGKQPAKLAEVILSERITIWYSTPSILRLLSEYGQDAQHDRVALRVVFFAGEVFPVKHLRAVMAMWPKPRYFNLYGPTETNVCTYFEVPASFPAERTEPFPIGKDCSGDVCIVADERGLEVPRGGEGELFAKGGSVMRGYWNLPQRNAEAFFIDKNGGRWYKTGDVVKINSEGDYEYLGRRDRMVKRRGYRVELGEIEAALYTHESVSEAAVVATPDVENGVVIRAFLNWSGEKSPSLIAMKQFCSKKLPLYMIPDKFIPVGTLPKTSTEKVDYQKLLEME
ncbi:MAG: amino acid adenylation domain-containing protein [Candidatus Hydrogenedentes bacterium]|nr:amino acid adenylation domain-containing protein [Candidatus Hydrogenedentota bacterium]